VGAEERVNASLFEKVASRVSAYYDEYCDSPGNLEDSLILNAVRGSDLGNMFFLGDVYDDFVGKNPQMSIYNSHEVERNFIFLKDRGRLSVSQIAEEFFYSLWTCLLNYDFIFLNFSSFFGFLICCFFGLINTFLLLLNVFLFIFFKILSAAYLFLFRIYKICGKWKIFFSKTNYFFVFTLFFYLGGGLLKHVLALLRGCSNMIFSFFDKVSRCGKILVDEKRNFSFENKKKGSGVDRNKKTAEQRSFLNFIYKKSKQKMKENAKHDLLYLKHFSAREFLLGNLDYRTLPSGEMKELYREVEQREKKKIIGKIIGKCLRMRRKKHLEHLNIIRAAEALPNRKIKNIENNLLENKILMKNLVNGVEEGKNLLTTKM
jgi:hypothetical protein